MRRSTQALLFAAGAAAALALASRGTPLARAARQALDDVKNRKRRRTVAEVAPPAAASTEDVALAERYDRYAG